MIFILSFCQFLFGELASAHIVGASPWCLANSPVHYECFSEERETCMKQAAKRSTPLERWECLSYPVDFRKIPKSGESLPSTNKTNPSSRENKSSQ